MNFTTICQIAGFINSIVSGIAALIAIYLFIFKRKTISSIFHLLLNYSFQITLTELTTKVELLNSLTVDDPSQRKEIIKIFNQISGQMKGNKILVERCDLILDKITKYANNPKGLTEPIKSNIANELRENLRTINVQTYNEIVKRQT